MIKIIKREINLVPVGRAFFWKILLGLAETVIWTLHHSCGAVVLHQICWCPLKWVLKMPLSYGWPFWCEREHISSNHRTPGTCWQTECLLLLFLGRGLHNASSQNRWTVVWHHVIGDIFASCFWNWGQMLACFSGIFMLWPTELAQENFWNLLKICGQPWPSLTPILRIVFSAFLNWIFSISNPSRSSLPKH